MTNNEVTVIENANYDASKYNAIKHGVLSKEAVLEWENQDDYNLLLTAFEEEYKPFGITETHLVTELAQIVWRKRRLRMAENSVIKTNLNSLDDAYKNCVKEKAIFGQSNIGNIIGKIKDSFKLTDEQAQEEIKEISKEIVKLENLLSKDYTYEEYQQNISKTIQNKWQDCLVNRYFTKDKDSFKKFIQEWCIDIYQGHLNRLLAQDRIKHEAISEAFEPTEKYTNLSRYENHLDRKFEKTLAMIVKLQELRNRSSSKPSN